MPNIKKCATCNTFTISDTCTACGASTESPHPPKYSQSETKANYRRAEKKKLREEKGA